MKSSKYLYGSQKIFQISQKNSKYLEKPFKYPIFLFKNEVILNHYEGKNVQNVLQ